MEKLYLTRRTIVLWVDLVLIVISLCGTTYMMRYMADGLSFGGFFVLFILVVLGIYYLALIGALFLLPLSIRSGKVRFAAIAAVLQILTPVPWLGLIRAFGYSYSWYEIIMIAGEAAGVALLAFLPVMKWRRKNPR